MKMDDQGNILVKKLSGKNVYVKSVSNAGEETSIGADVLKLPNYCLETDKPVKVGIRLIYDNYYYIIICVRFVTYIHCVQYRLCEERVIPGGEVSKDAR